MSKKNKNQRINIVYSTDPDYDYQYNHTTEKKTLIPCEQILKITLDKKNRQGKTVTIISGFIGLSTDLESLAREIKSYCGVGGSVKNEKILLQGIQKEKSGKYLTGKGYKVK